VKEGTLIVELYDQASRQRVWRSIATDTLATPDMIEEQIRTFVKKSFADFPPKPSGSEAVEKTVKTRSGTSSF
jgi:hypothetical protein